jgi:D-lactate dehydrogenase
MNWDVFFYEAFKEEQQALQQYLPSNLSAGFTWQTIQEYGDSQPPAPLISIRTQSIIPVSWAKLLRGVLTRSTGFNHIHTFWRQSQTSLLTGYLPLYCSRTVAEQAVLSWMALLRKLPQQVAQFKTFNRDNLTGRECWQKTLLVVGVGNIGYEVVKLGKALGMNVLGVDIEKKYPDVTYVTIADGLPVADVVVAAMNLTSSNQGYFNYSSLRRGKPGLIFVNVGRGECSPSIDLLRLLEENFLGGLALDVYDQESELAIHLRSREVHSNATALAVLKLAEYPNVILTPHNAFNSQEALARKSAQSIQQVTYFLEQGQFLWMVPLVELEFAKPKK